MRDSILHRGPDGSGLRLFDGGHVGLAHRRLAIVDLTEGGHQPMSSQDGRRHIIFNGEIYNHKELRDELRGLGRTFHSACDTEVLLAAYEHWGEEALNRLSGMFAFAIYDHEMRTLFAARDRAGEKPFFYRHGDGKFLFASELKALFNHPDMPRHVDSTALDHYLAYGYVPRGLCLLEGYAKLPAGHKLRYDLNSDRLEVEAYWALPRFSAAAPQPLDQLAHEFDSLLEAAVRRQLTADVPVGILLSGGLDSSLIAATAASVAGKVTTFTIGFPDHAEIDESSIAKRLAGELGTEHIELMAEPGTLDLLPKLAEQFDEPIADSSMIPTYLVSKLVRSRATVALGGDGGDELFGGYLNYERLAPAAWVRRLGLHRLPLSGLVAQSLPQRLAGRRMALRLVDSADGPVTVARLAEPQLRQMLIGGCRAAPFRAAEKFRMQLIERWREPRERAMALDFLTYMCDDVLVKVDRSSMLASLEVRAPLLDRNIIEFAFARLAPAQRVGSGGRKLLLRHLARKRLPAWFDSRRKQGFSIPLSAWLRGPWAPLLEDLAASAGEGLLDPAAVRKFLRAGSSADRLGHQIYQLAMLELWRRQYNVSWG